MLNVKGREAADTIYKVFALSEFELKSDVGCFCHFWSTILF